MQLLKEKVSRAIEQGFVYVNGEKIKVNGYCISDSVVALFDGSNEVCNKNFELNDGFDPQFFNTPNHQSNY